MIKPCPFCGCSEHLFTRAEQTLDPDYIEDHVVCGMCGVRALKKDCLGWNNRPIENALNATIARLEGKIQGMQEGLKI